MAGQVHAERELHEPVALCRRDGSLHAEAVGWSRRPLHRCNLARRWLAKKRWNYWAVTTESQLFSATIANLDYAGLAGVYWGDLASGELVERTVITPFGRGVALGDTVDAPAAFRHGDLALEFRPTGEGVELRVEARAVGGEPLVAELAIAYPKGHETLNVVVPWNERTFQFTAKHNTLPARGTVRRGTRELRFEGSQSFACLDFGRGVWPRRCAWNWGSASGQRNGRSIGLNLGGQWTDGTGATENALCVGGRLSKVSEDLSWSYDRRDFTRPWRIVAPTTSQVDLTFVPVLERVAASQLGPIRSSARQLFGHYRGVIVTAEGETVELRDLMGWAEEHVAWW